MALSGTIQFAGAVEAARVQLRLRFKFADVAVPQAKPLSRALLAVLFGAFVPYGRCVFELLAHCEHESFACLLRAADRRFNFLNLFHLF